MRITTLHLSCAMLLSALAVSASGQTAPAATSKVQTLQDPAQIPAPVALPAAQAAPAAPAESFAVQQLRGFKDSDAKFDLRDLMAVLRDGRHEGWVLAAYPDPKTAQALIGAGVSLDLPAREHSQPDPLNPHPFIEPSSAEIWQAAGLDSDHLHAILDQFDARMAKWAKKGFRKRIKTLAPDITDGDAEQLLRVSAIQAIYNAKGYCRDFDSLSASQQMALSQMVYQIGFNLPRFSHFLELINNDQPASTGELAGASSEAGDLAALSHALPADPEFWKTVQQTLTESQWARVYRVRAVSVIAMLDPQYTDGPGAAERRVGAMFRPAVVQRRRAAPAASRQLASLAGHSSRHRPGSGRRGRLAAQRKRGA
jgi:hypothetical protein